MKVLYFIPSFSSGGSEAFIVNVIEKIDRNKIEPEILCIDATPSIYDRRLEKIGVKVQVLIKRHIKNPIKRYFLSYRLFSKFLKEKISKYDVIHFNISQGEELPFISISKKYGVPIRIMHSHNSSVNSLYKYYGHVLSKKIYFNAPTHFFACSDVAAKWLVPPKKYKNKEYTIIKNGIDTEKYKFNLEDRNEKRNELSISKEIVFLNIGRLGNQKNQKFLIEAYAKISCDIPNSLLIIVGDGPLSMELKEKAVDLGLSEKVMFLGNRTDIPQLLSAADIFLLPSLYEGLPFTLVEAQNSGLPCIISDVISEQCILTDLVQKVPLNIDEYTAAVENTTPVKVSKRDVYSSIVKKQGFDIDMTARFLEDFYYRESVNF